MSPAELAAEHLLVYSSVPEESFLLRRVLGPLGLTPRRVSFIMLTEAMIELARAGMGVGILPRWSAQRAIAAAPSCRCRSPGGGCGAAGRRPRSPRSHAGDLADFIDLVAERALPARSRQTA